jgi:hypothetical protein
MNEESATNEDASAEAMHEESATRKGAMGDKAETAKAKSTKMSKAPEMPETAKVSEAATTETVTPKPYYRCLRMMRDIHTWKSDCSGLDFRKRQSGECNCGYYKLMLEHWDSPFVTSNAGYLHNDRCDTRLARNRCTTDTTTELRAIASFGVSC